MEMTIWSPETPIPNVCYVNLLPDELWLSIFRLFHPVYEDLFTLSLVCKKWYRLLIQQPDPSLWEQVRLSSVRYCTPESTLFNRYKTILDRFGGFIKTLSIHRCHEHFSNSLQQYVPSLITLQNIEITGMKWNKKILRKLVCFKSLRSVVLEATEAKSEMFAEEDLYYLSENFPNLRTLGLQFSSLKSEGVSTLTKLSSSLYSDKITNLSVERGKLGTLDLSDIIQSFSHLTNFSYGNDQIYGWPSVQSLALESRSILEVDIFHVGDVAEFAFHLPCLRKLRVNNSTSVESLQVIAPSLRLLALTNCVELRKLTGINALSLEELVFKGCTALSQGELLNFLVKNSDIKSLEIGVHWAHLRLDQHSNPSLKELFISDNGESLATVDIRCPKLTRLSFKKLFLRPTKLKAVRILGDKFVHISLCDVPYLRKLTVDATMISKLEINFDRTADQIKPVAFTKIKFLPTEMKLKYFVLKKCNLNSVALSSCNVQHVIFDSCNLDCTLCEILGQCGAVESVTFTRCYGPCQLFLRHAHVKEVHINSCSMLMMERITLVCPSLELLGVNQCSFLPTEDELECISNNLRSCCPKLQSVKFSY